MKTIAITIDDSMIHSIDRILSSGDANCKNRSHLIRQAVREYLDRLEKNSEEEREREILHRHRVRLKLQATVLVKEQAKL